MPRDLFAAPSITTVRSARRRLTLVCSTIAHIGVLALIVAVPLLSGLSLPELSSRMDFLNVFAAPPMPPAPRPSAPAVASPQPPSPSDVTPTEAPSTIGPDREPPARASRDAPPAKVLTR